MFKIEFVCANEKDTEKLGEKLAGLAVQGDVFALFGTLGMGKSVLSRAFIQKLTNASEVPSPTFTLVQTYEAPDFDIYHFDLYRIKNPEEIFELAMEEALYQGVSLIEWPEKMGAYLPRDIFKIEITPFGSGRKIAIETADAKKQQRLAALDY
uniref:tRNA threonylcarbamoyladenosine biosynthesis protein TsaE n=1 Tax=uncultured Alphaproteobacteria bacterium TaxID=91750 RepID=A0A6M4NMS7_9PROT|nr:tRNA (adenosine(37)-N6)-threonylcarbamoyltransferase complex ATPase subunit type 1 TsaE [uncultured Alphaproteobacteria bacterium]